MNPVVHVMVGVLRDPDRRVLINQRPAGKVQAGRWEFPGGKLEEGESPEAGLRRELREELGIVAGRMRRLLQIQHAYPDFTVRLDVREVLTFGGVPQPRESQALKWVAPDELVNEDILEADRAIIQALRLPDTLLVTPDAAHCPRDVFLESLRLSLESGIRLVQLRSKALSTSDYARLARDVLPVCRRHGAMLLLNAAPELLAEVPADGIHLDSRRLHTPRHRPVPPHLWLSAACHTRRDILQAEHLAADFVLIGAVKPTPSHPDETPVGWPGFRALVADCNMPAFALGGMSEDDLEPAWAAGGRGVAGIRSFWRG